MDSKEQEALEQLQSDSRKWALVKEELQRRRSLALSHLLAEELESPAKVEALRLRVRFLDEIMHVPEDLVRELQRRKVRNE